VKFLPLELPGVFLIEPEPLADDRGFFARTWCSREFADHGLVTAIAQCSLSYNRRKGTLRGMHYQAPPHEEVKIVRCTAGAIYDVVIDLRPGSPTRGRWLGVELSAANRRQIYVPAGFAHGFQALVDDTEVFYQISQFYHPESARGLRYDDPAFGIRWPLGDLTVSERDLSFPEFRP
jgi:dTDP-4-dehydrorhamnose 3,5-epimerase